MPGKWRRRFQEKGKRSIPDWWVEKTMGRNAWNEGKSGRRKHAEKAAYGRETRNQHLCPPCIALEDDE